MKTGNSDALRLLRVELGRGVFCLGLTLLSAAAAFAAPSMPAGSFLRQPAESVQALKQQINDDPLVCKRYARLYNLPVADVRAAFAHLRLTRLKQDMVAQVHYVHTGERIGYKVRRVRKGTPIYTFEDGTPVLVQVCGNPFRPRIRPHVTLSPPETELPFAVAEFNENEALEAIPSSRAIETNGLRGGPPTGQLPPPLDFVEVPNVPEEAPTDTSTTRLHRQPPVQHIKNWGNGGLLLLPLAAVPFLFGGGGGGESSSGTSPVIPPTGSQPSPPSSGSTETAVTPEPDSLVLFLVGGCGILIPAWRAYRSRRTS